MEASKIDQTNITVGILSCLPRESQYKNREVISSISMDLFKS
jgi:hypothetical protein